MQGFGGGSPLQQTARYLTGRGVRSLQVFLRPILVSLVAALAIAAGGAGSAGAKQQNFTWHHIHLHLNAYGEWGSGCVKLSGYGGVSWDDYSGWCMGETGAELGELGGVSFINYRSKTNWTWNGAELNVWGYDKSGKEWRLYGRKSDNFWDFYVETGKIGSGQYISGALNAGARGEQGGPLKIYLSYHSSYSSPGYSMNLQGWVRVK